MWMVCRFPLHYRNNWDCAWNLEKVPSTCLSWITLKRCRWIIKVHPERALRAVFPSGVCDYPQKWRPACGHRTCGCRINTRLVFSPGSLQTQFFHTRCKRARLDCKQLRGSALAVHFPPCFVQRRQNIRPLGVTYFFLGAHLNRCRIGEPLWL